MAILRATVKVLLAEKPVWITKPGPYHAVEDSLIDLLLDAKAPAPVEYTVVGGNFPSGARLDARTGHIGSRPTGVPAPEGVYTFTVRATNTSTKVWEDASFTIIIKDVPNVPRWITPAILPSTSEDASLSIQLEVNQPVTFELVSGELPQGITLDAAGKLAGIVPRVGAAGATAMFTIRASDDDGNFADRTFTLDINNVDHTPQWISSGIIQVDEGVSVATRLNATTTSTGLRYEILSGELPEGFTLNPSSGELTGTAPQVNTEGRSWRFTVDAVSDHGEHSPREFTLVVRNTPHVPVWQTRPDITVQEEATVDVQLSATSDQPFTVRIVNSTLPAGIQFNTETLKLQGVAPLVGAEGAQYEITLAAENAFDERADITVRVRVTNIDNTPVWLTNSVLGEVEERSPLQLDLLAQCRVPFTLAVVDQAGLTGSGLSLAQAGTVDVPVMKLSGTANEVTAAGATYEFTLRATARTGETSDRTFRLAVTNFDLTPVWETRGLGDQFEETQIDVPLHVRSLNPYVISLVSGTLPTGVTLDAANRKLTGVTPLVPPAGETFTFTLRATNDRGETADATLALRVIDVAHTPTWITTALASYVEHTDVNETLEASSDVAVTYSIVAGSLPAGVQLNATTGKITGRAPEVAKGGRTFEITARVTARTGEYMDRNFVLAVTDLDLTPVWQTSSIGDQLEETTIQNIQLTATSTSMPITYSVVSGSLPQGITMSTAGVLSGRTPSVTPAGATSTFAVRATNARGESADRTFTLRVTNVNQAPTWTTAAKLPDASGTKAYSVALAATDPDNDTLTFSWVSGDMPQGFAVSGATLGGTPEDVSAPVTYTFVLRVSDGVLFADREFTLTVRVNPDKFVNRQYVANEAYYTDKPNNMGQVDV